MIGWKGCIVVVEAVNKILEAVEKDSWCCAGCFSRGCCRNCADIAVDMATVVGMAEESAKGGRLASIELWDTADDEKLAGGGAKLGP